MTFYILKKKQQKHIIERLMQIYQGSEPSRLKEWALPNHDSLKKYSGNCASKQQKISPYGCFFI